MSCGQRGWPEEDQDYGNPCVCALHRGHGGLHECFEGCGSTWAGGLSAEPDEREEDRG